MDYTEQDLEDLIALNDENRPYYEDRLDELMFTRAEELLTRLIDKIQAADGTPDAAHGIVREVLDASPRLRGSALISACYRLANAVLILRHPTMTETVTLEHPEADDE